MQIKKFKFNSDIYFIAVVDENDVVITSGTFNSMDDAETATDLLYTIIVRCGLQKFCNSDIPESLKSNVSLNDIFKEIGVSDIPDMVIVDN